ncbi:MAG TPA: sigma-54 dependent transcriptional regulator [Burkholderiales bacterium]|nr:sigma-54 dependent transcriptional regulator [Burkholderiales bacterium]
MLTNGARAPEPGAHPARPALLVVDDDRLITDTLAFALGGDYEVYTCDSRAAAIARVRTLAAPPPLALVDLGLPPAPHSPEEGFQLIADLLAHAPAMKIFVLSGQNEAANARHARALGAWEFVAKPADPALLRRLFARALAIPAAEETDLVGASPALARLKNQIAQFAGSPYPVLIEGESGSGKELTAASLHRLSPRAARPYLTLNCAAISPTLVEATLFGYVKGAFTGAAANKPGYFEDAQDGTLLLDEIGELPLELQAKLLRVLENGEYQRVGETQRRLARCRVFAATNRDLRRDVKNGAFRADLYHRLSVFTLSVPPLREMEGDNVVLLERFRRFYAERSGVQPFELDPAALACWSRYDFPGNVRELRNVVIRLTAKYPGQRLSSAELEPELDLDASLAASQASGIAEQAQRQLGRGGAFNLDETLKAWERGYIEAALRLTRGNVSQAARLLGLNRTTLYSRMNWEPGEKK